MRRLWVVVSASTIVELIGNTPLVKLNSPNPKVSVFAKLEKLNPGGSIKARAVKYMIEGAEKRGELKHGKILVEATSGNTGIAIAMIAAAKGYKAKLVMSEGASIERRKIMKAFGAEVILTPAKLGTDGAIAKAQEILKSNPSKYVMIDQYDNPDNVRAHYETTANEIWEQTDGKVTHVVACIGTSGTIMGLSKRLKELNSRIRIIGVEPAAGEKIDGLKNMEEQIRPSIYKANLIDELHHVTRFRAISATRKIARSQGILVGMSSGAAIHVAFKLAKTLKSGVIVAIAPDGGERYLTTELFGGD